MIIFLDIDGVLNTEKMWEKAYSISPVLVKRLGILVKDLKAEVVLTSTWKEGFSRKNSYSTPQIIELINLMNSNGYTITDKTPTLQSHNRTKEIEQYIITNNVDKYIILDDDISLFDEGTKHLYLINSKTGITDTDIKKIKKEVKKQKISLKSVFFTVN